MLQRKYLVYCYYSRKNGCCNHFKKYEESLVRRADKIRECGKKHINPEKEDLDKNAMNRGRSSSLLKWMLNRNNFYIVPSYTNVEQYSQFSRKILNFVLLFNSCYINLNVLVKIDFWQDFVDFLIISKFSFPPILKTHSCYRYLQTLFPSLWITNSNELLHIEWCLCVISIFRIFVLIWTFWTLATILVQNMKFF